MAHKLIVHLLSPERRRDRFFKKSEKKMAMYSEDKEKVQLEEQASWAKLCSKLVSNNIYILKTPFKGRLMFLIPVWMLDVKF